MQYSLRRSGLFVPSVQPSDIVAGTKGYGLLSGATGGIYDPITRKNRILNGAFRISQRSTMPTADDSYCLDQWNLLLEAANAATVAQETSDTPVGGSRKGIRLTVGSGNNNKFGIVNFIEADECFDLRGKTVSLQFKMKSTAGIADVRAAVIEWTSTVDTITSDVVGTWNAAGTNPTLATNWAYCSGYTPVSLAPTTSWVQYKIEGISVGTSMNNLAVLIWSDDKTTTQTTDILRITDVQLEEGALCTNFERRQPQAELMECCRFVRILGPNGTGVVNTATRILISEVFDPPMRVNPTATLVNTAFQVLEVGIGFQTGVSSTIFGSSLRARGVYLDIDGYTGLTTSPPSPIRVVSADFALLSAEL
jgi:hypothetical protein